MQIQLDFDRKVITINDIVNLKEFIYTLENMLPDFSDWNITSRYSHNILFNEQLTINTPQQGKPWWQVPQIIGGNQNYSNIHGIYQIDIDDTI